MEKSQFNEINKTIKLYMLRQEYKRCLRGTKIHENIYHKCIKSYQVWDNFSKTHS